MSYRYSSVRLTLSSAHFSVKLIPAINGKLGVFEVADHDSGIRIAKLKMADPRWRLCNSNVEFFEQFAQNTLYGGFSNRRLQDYFTLILKFSNNWHKTWCMGIFWVADYNSEVRIGKLKIWCQNCKIRNVGSKMAAILVQIVSFFAIAPKLGILGFSGSLIAILISVLQNYSPSQHNPELTTWTWGATSSSCFF